MTAAVAWFLVLYPNISALPLPAVVAQRLPGHAADLPVPVPVPDEPRPRSSKDVQLLDPIAWRSAGALVLLCIVLAYSAWVWRIAIAEREADGADAAAGGVMTGSPGG